MEIDRLKITPVYRNLILYQLIFPISLLTLGIYHGLIQTFYRAGWIRSNSFLGLEYYQGLTLHGVINAVVFTTFFAVGFGNVIILYYLKKNFSALWGWIAGLMMGVGTLITAGAILSGTSSVLYTFYPPLKAHPTFYIGAVLLVVGSWIAFFSWIPVYRQWKKENPQQKTPLAVVGIIATFIVWLSATLPLAYEVLGLLLPWSMGFVPEINVTLARTLFWFFGHALVYFWLLPAYLMYYVFLPKLAGGKLFSDFAGRLAFLTFIVLSAPVGLHHQLTDPGIGEKWKWLHAIFTFGVAFPSFLTAFTLAASLEIAGKMRGGRGLFQWWSKLPYLDEDRWLFSYLFVGLVIFIFGGVTGIVNASVSMNSLVHNTAWMPGHFHMTVGGPVFLAFIGMSLFLISQLSGKRIRYKKAVLAVPYLWLFGIVIFSTSLSISGILHNEPRRTNMGLTYTNPSSPLFDSGWHLSAVFTAVGGILMTFAMIFYFISFISTLLAKREHESIIELPTSESFHDEQIPFVQSFKPYILMMILALLFAYVPPLLEIPKNAPFTSSPFVTDSPISPQKENPKP
ncbi:MAG: cbb3-type cytochrome c oxidase subunit I [Deltaproteobacteria bacterium]|nr:cbb3-type cytochrome c oxidase subunit I [Deltaproteobacteria bacterium]